MQKVVKIRKNNDEGISELEFAIGRYDDIEEVYELLKLYNKETVKDIPKVKSNPRKKEISFTALIVGVETKRKSNPESNEKKDVVNKEKGFKEAPNFEKRYMKLVRLFNLSHSGPVIGDELDILDRANNTDHKPYLESLFQEAKTPSIKHFIRHKLDMLYSMMDAPKVEYKDHHRKIGILPNPRVRSVKGLQKRIVENIINLYQGIRDSQYGSPFFVQSVRLIMWAQGLFFEPEKNAVMTALMFDRLFDKKSDVPDMEHQVKRILQLVQDENMKVEEVYKKFIPGSFSLKAVAMFNRSNMAKAEYYRFASNREAHFINNFLDLNKTVALIDLINFFRIYMADKQVSDVTPLIKDFINKISKSAFNKRFDGEKDEVWGFRLALENKIEEIFNDFKTDADILIRKASSFIDDLFATEVDKIEDKIKREHRKLQKMLNTQRKNLNKSHDDQDEDYYEDEEDIELEEGEDEEDGQIEFDLEEDQPLERHREYEDDEEDEDEDENKDEEEEDGENKNKTP